MAVYQLVQYFELQAMGTNMVFKHDLEGTLVSQTNYVNLRN